MASEWNLWLWVECIDVASGCCCKDKGGTDGGAGGPLAHHFYYLKA